MDDFIKMYHAANEIIRKDICCKYTQAMVLLTNSGILYSNMIQNSMSDNSIDEIKIIDELKEKNDTEVAKLLCVWKNGQIDLTSYKFRKMLANMNAKNCNTKMFLQGKDTIIMKEIAQTEA